jgi:hypothetical protein
VQDRERGVVWEETIIFLQDDAKMVSASGFALGLPVRFIIDIGSNLLARLSC